MMATPNSSNSSGYGNFFCFPTANSVSCTSSNRGDVDKSCLFTEEECREMEETGVSREDDDGTSLIDFLSLPETPRDRAASGCTIPPNSEQSSSGDVVDATSTLAVKLMADIPPVAVSSYASDNQTLLHSRGRIIDRFPGSLHNNELYGGVLSRNKRRVGIEDNRGSRSKMHMSDSHEESYTLRHNVKTPNRSGLACDENNGRFANYASTNGINGSSMRYEGEINHAGRIPQHSNMDIGIKGDLCRRLDDSHGSRVQQSHGTIGRRGGRSRKKQTKYDAAYKQMEKLGNFSVESRKIDLDSLCQSSVPYEVLSAPHKYTYDKWHEGFSIRLGADGRRLLLRKLRSIYGVDPEGWEPIFQKHDLDQKNVFTMATVNVLFKIAHVMGKDAWDFALKCACFTHKCNALLKKDLDFEEDETSSPNNQDGSSSYPYDSRSFVSSNNPDAASGFPYDNRGFVAKRRRQNMQLENGQSHPRSFKYQHNEIGDYGVNHLNQNSEGVGRFPVSNASNQIVRVSRPRSFYGGSDDSESSGNSSAGSNWHHIHEKISQSNERRLPRLTRLSHETSQDVPPYQYRALTSGGYRSHRNSGSGLLSQIPAAAVQIDPRQKVEQFGSGFCQDARLEADDQLERISGQTYEQEAPPETLFLAFKTELEKAHARFQKETMLEYLPQKKVIHTSMSSTTDTDGGNFRTESEESVYRATRQNAAGQLVGDCAIQTSLTCVDSHMCLVPVDCLLLGWLNNQQKFLG